MTNLEKAQAWVDYRATGRNAEAEDANEVLFEWIMEAYNTGRDEGEVIKEKYGLILRAIELNNSDDPYSIMTANERAFTERMTDREPRVYLEGAALEEHEKRMAAAQVVVDADNEIIRLERIEMERASFEEMFP